MINRKNAQIGEGLTWIVATFVILVILAGGIFMAQGLGKAKSLLGWEKGSSFIKISDRLVETSFNSYLLTKGQDGKTIYGQIRIDGDLNAFNGELAKKVFRDLYEGNEYSRTWFGVSSISGDQLVGKDNSFLGGKPRNPIVGDPSFGDLDIIPGLTYLSSSRWIKDQDFVQIFFTKKLNLGNP
jgi:hypothetical protein